eukprot:gene5354-biopygen4060
MRTTSPTLRQSSISSRSHHCGGDVDSVLGSRPGSGPESQRRCDEQHPVVAEPQHETFGQVLDNKKDDERAPGPRLGSRLAPHRAGDSNQRRNHNHQPQHKANYANAKQKFGDRAMSAPPLQQFVVMQLGCVPERLPAHAMPSGISCDVANQIPDRAALLERGFVPEPPDARYQAYGTDRAEAGCHPDSASPPGEERNRRDAEGQQ